MTSPSRPQKDLLNVPKHPEQWEGAQFTEPRLPSDAVVGLPQGLEVLIEREANGGDTFRADA